MQTEHPYPPGTQPWFASSLNSKENWLTLDKTTSSTDEWLLSKEAADGGDAHWTSATQTPGAWVDIEVVVAAVGRAATSGVGAGVGIELETPVT